MVSNARFKVLIYVQHLLGTGHLRRAALLAKALADGPGANASGAKPEVVLISGGMPVANLNCGDASLVQLPPVRARDANFSELVDTNGKEVTATYMSKRKRVLLEAYHAQRPQIIVTETFPFGRRQMREEILALLEQAERDAVTCVASIRDILQSGRKPKRLEEAVQWVNRFYRHVLVHGDPSFVKIDATFERAADIEVPLTYTGFIAPIRTHRRRRSDVVRTDDILVSAGGGAVGLNLYETAIGAAKRTQGEGDRWHLLVGGNLAAKHFERLAADATDNVIVERERADFFALLQTSAASVSQAGYNTMLDILQSEVPAIVIPFAERGETEQLLRSERLASLGLAVVLPEESLSVDSLIGAVRQARNLPKPRVSFQFDGAARAAAILRGMDSVGVSQSYGEKAP